MKTIFKNQRLIRIGRLGLPHLNQTVTLAGGVSNLNLLGKVIFCQLRDGSGTIQLLVKNSSLSLLNQFKTLKKETVIEVIGLVQQRTKSAKITPPANLEIMVSHCQILNPSRLPPFLIADPTDGQEKIRMQYRYLDLRRGSMQHYLKLRAKLQRLIRHFMDEHQIWEINTPILSFPNHEGAQEFRITSQAYETKQAIALPQSPQLYKQLLMTAGFGAYYQLAHCFRDEALRMDRQPEFMQLDLEIAFANSADVCGLIEQLLVRVGQQFHQIKLPTPLPQMDYQVALNRYGTAKPDCRFELFLQDFSAEFKSFLPDQQVLKAVLPPRSLTTAELGQLNQALAKIKPDQLIIYQNQRLIQVPATGSQQLIAAVKACLQKRNLSTFIGCYGQLKSVNQLLGHVRRNLGSLLGLITAQTADRLVWIVKPPLFEFNPETKQYQPVHHPFCRPVSTVNLDQNGKTATADAYDLIINGMEVASGSKRIHEVDLQRFLFTKSGLSPTEQSTNYGFFLTAMQYGMPPHAGIGLGIERLLQCLTNARSIRDFIAFPKTTTFDALWLKNKVENTFQN